MYGNPGLGVRKRRNAHVRIHTETGQRPLDRFLAGGPPRMPDPAVLAEAFRWSVTRAVTKTATVSLQGNRYQVDPSLIGYRVELRYDPEDLTRLDVYLEGDHVGVATPLVIGRHVHPAVPQAQPPQAPPTGVDYLGLVLAQQEETLGGSISYRDVPLFGDEDGDGLVGVRR
jgi:putative transposase